MPVADLRKPTLITQARALRELVETFSKETIISVDTEANSLHAYQERVCLIQFSIPQADFLVDPLLLDDLSPLGSVFANPDIEKIFHAAEYDLIILKRDFDFEFANLFDTMLAARILGWKAVGLGSILKSRFGVNVDKRYQRANWGKRPIPPEMQTYAQLDTHFLIDLRNLQKADLIEKGRWLLAEEDFRRATQVRLPENNNSGADCFRINGAYELTPQQLAVLQALCEYRDQIARSLDRPLFKVINNNTLVEIAASCPQTFEQLSHIRGMTKGQMKWHGTKILNLVQRGLKAPPPQRKRKSRPDPEYLMRVDTLRQWRKKKARSIGVESDVVLPKDLLNTMAEKYPFARNELNKILQSVPWRLDHFGDEIFQQLKHS